MASPNSDSYDGHTRKRVGKACDRCRLKKSKCDGLNPCSRCKADNAICVFGERKKSHDKVYPKGYVEMLEQQQSQLVAGVRSMYRKLVENEAWPGTPLHEQTEGHPLTHDILDRLDVLHMTGENPAGPEAFEDDLDTLQRQLLDRGAPFASGRRTSPSTDSDPGLAHTDSPHSTPMMSTTSEMSSSHSRKRSSPETPALQSAYLTLPSKRRSYNVSDFVQSDFQQSDADFPVYQEPWVNMNSNANSIPDLSFYPYDSNSLFNSSELNYTTSPATWSLAEAGLGLVSQDDEFEGFRRSGFHGYE